VRRHAKASTAGSTRSRSVGHRSIIRGALPILCLAAFLWSASPVLAGTASERPLLFAFDGSDTPAGAFSNPNALEIEQASGTVYVIDEGRGVLDKFDAAGVAQSFSATGSASLAPGINFNFLSDVAVDNYGPNLGRIHVMREFGPVKAFSPTGTGLWELDGFSDVCGLAVDIAGHPWIGDWSNSKAREFAASGSPPAEVGSFSTGSDRPCRLDFDASGNAYVDRLGGGVDKYEGGIKVATIDSVGSGGVTVDQSSASGHVFTLHGESFNEYDASGGLIGSFGVGTIGDGRGIAYNAALDHVYVSDAASDTVEVFGPVATGTVPDTTIEATTEIGINKATFHGKVNPQSVPNSYHFEWKQGEGSSWGGAQSSAPQTLAEDSADHAVSFNATGLAGGTTYQVRLVGTNTENGFRVSSAADTFETAIAASAPAVTIAAPSSVTGTSAQLSGTVNPIEDGGTTWQVQTSTDPSCTSAFSGGPTHNLESEANSPIAVAEELTALLPNQHYCVRIAATNSAGTTISQAVEFETDPVVPSQAITAFAAPRTDTGARLNGYVNPEGAALTYHFEYSEDGGGTWISLPDLEDSSRARKQIVVSQELEGLEPDTTYLYRFVAENEAGAASPQGGSESFTTRTTAETILPKRGIELVNNPDKGNQHVRTLEPQGDPLLSADGEDFIWSVAGGAPGGTSAAFNSFLATRGPDGWRSTSVVPPASQQVGGGELRYIPVARTPDFSHFLFVTEEAAVAGPESTYLRLDRSHNQDVLATFPADGLTHVGEISDDASHVLHRNEATGMLEDIGSGSPEVVGLMPDGSLPACGVSDDFAGADESGLDLTLPGYRWIATDASRVYFVSQGNSCGGAFGRPLGLYVRNRDTESTTQIAENVDFLRATPDGSAAYFLTSEQLADDDENAHHDAYRWQEDGSYDCLTCVVSDAELPTGQSFSQVLVSDDFSHIYFRSPKQLIPGLGVPGVLNMYVIADGELRFVATTGADELHSSASVQLSADGNLLAFVSAQQLTSDRRVSACKGFELHPCQELYVYDDRTESIECISCLRGGVTSKDMKSESPVETVNFRMSRDGSTVAFVTAESLVPQDANGTSDVYQWRNGTVGLITDGETEYPVGFAAPRPIAIDSDGSDLIFQVDDPGLTGYEQDGVDNLYDARIGGGFPRPSAPVHCDGDSCQGPLQEPPQQSPPSSSSFRGSGNAARQGAGRCRAGAVRRGRRCVSKRALRRRACRHKRGDAKRRCVHRGARRSR
jgi:hypothetical protein